MRKRKKKEGASARIAVVSLPRTPYPSIYLSAQFIEISIRYVNDP